MIGGQTRPGPYLHMHRTTLAGIIPAEPSSGDSCARPRMRGGSSGHLASLWLTLLPGMISSPPQYSEPARQLSDPGDGVLDGLHSPVVRDLDGRDMSSDLLEPLSQLSQRVSRVVR